MPTLNEIGPLALMLGGIALVLVAAYLMWGWPVFLLFAGIIAFLAGMVFS